MGWAERLNPNSRYNNYGQKEKEEQIMWETLGRAGKRLFRASVALLIAGALATANKDPKLLLFAPLIQAVAKYLRDKLGLTYFPL